MSWYSLTVRRFIYVFIYWLWFTHAVPPIAVPPIPRPSDEQFIDYTKEGNTDQVTEAMRYYQDLISIQDKVGGVCDGFLRSAMNQKKGNDSQ